MNHRTTRQAASHSAASHVSTSINTTTTLKKPPPSSWNENSDADRQRALKRIEKEGAVTIWKHLPQSWQHSKDFILAVLHNHAHAIPDKSEFERTFPQSLRFDPDVVLGFCQRPDFVLEEQDRGGLYYERHLYVPGCLTSHKAVMLAYCQKIPRSLQDCSEELCNDRDMVKAAITHCSGLELQYASSELQQDLDLLRLACKNHGRALEFCPPLSKSRELLVNDREFMLHTVLSSPGGGPMWKVLPPSLQENDDELVLKALEHGLLLRDVPKHYIRLDFLTTALQQNCLLYLELKTIKSNQQKWQHHPTLAMEAIVNEKSTAEVHALALEGCPSLKENRQAVMAVCQRGSLDTLRELLGDPDEVPVDNNAANNNNNDLFLAAVLQANLNAGNAANVNPGVPMMFPPRVQVQQPPPLPRAAPAQPTSRFADDMEIMKLAVARDPAFFTLASARLQSDPELILASITPTSAWNTLKTVSWAIQREHPEITIKAIRLCDSRNLRYLPTHIPEELWTAHRDVPITWIQRGGRVLEHFERILRGDADMALQLAKHNWAEFYKVGDRLLSDRAFVLQALDMDGRVLRFVAPSVRQDFDVAITAIANHYKNIAEGAAMRAAPSVTQTLSGILDLNRVKTEIQRLLDLHDTYVKEFLRGIAIKTPHLAPALRSQLTMLDRGIETSQAFKRLIAEYCGVPVGAKLALLRKAHDNLQRPPNGSATSYHRLPIQFFARDDNGGGNDDRRAIRRFRFLARRNRDAAGNNDDDDDEDDDDDAPDADAMPVRGPARYMRMREQMRRDMQDNARVGGAAAARMAPDPRRHPMFGRFGMMDDDDDDDDDLVDLMAPAPRLGLFDRPERPQRPERPAAAFGGMLDGPTVGGLRWTEVNAPPAAARAAVPPAAARAAMPPPAAAAARPSRSSIFDEPTADAARAAAARAPFMPGPIMQPPTGSTPGSLFRMFGFNRDEPDRVSAAAAHTARTAEYVAERRRERREQERELEIHRERMRAAVAPRPWPPVPAASAEQRRRDERELEFHREQMRRLDIRRRPSRMMMEEPPPAAAAMADPPSWVARSSATAAAAASPQNQDARAIQEAERRRRESDERLARLEARNARHRAIEQEESIRRTFPGFRAGHLDAAPAPPVPRGLEDRDIMMLGDSDEEDLFFDMP